MIMTNKEQLPSVETVKYDLYPEQIIELYKPKKWEWVERIGIIDATTSSWSVEKFVDGRRFTATAIVANDHDQFDIIEIEDVYDETSDCKVPELEKVI